MSKYVAFYSRKPQSGKDTVAHLLRLLLSEAGVSHYTTHFAKPLKTIVAEATGLRSLAGFTDEPERDQEQIIKLVDDLKLHGEVMTTGEEYVGFLRVTGREFLVNVATAIRQYDNQFFVKAIAADVAREREENRDGAHIDVVLIPDLRFQIEADWVREQGGIVVEVDPGERHGPLQPINEELVQADHRIDNSGTMDELHARIPALLGVVSRTRSVWQDPDV